MLVINNKKMLSQLPKDKYFCSNKSFTLIELLIVLLIIGIGFMSITPKLFEGVVEPNKKVSFFNDLLEKYAKKSYKEGFPITLEISKNVSKITVKGDNKEKKNDKKEEIEIPFDTLINSIEVNGERTFSNNYSINIYPDKICDYFIINFNDDTSIESIPLLLKVSEVK
jgi:prepilin-type N-terminal cleavage/methylation domain-containing protein